jgi:hypothetical protein
MSAGSISWGVKAEEKDKIIVKWAQEDVETSNNLLNNNKGGRCVRLTTYHHPVPLSLNLGTLTSWNPLGLSRPVMGLLFLMAQVNAPFCDTGTLKTKML